MSQYYHMILVLSVLGLEFVPMVSGAKREGVIRFGTTIARGYTTPRTATGSNKEYGFKSVNLIYLVFLLIGKIGTCPKLSRSINNGTSCCSEILKKLNVPACPTTVSPYIQTPDSLECCDSSKLSACPDDFCKSLPFGKHNKY